MNLWVGNLEDKDMKKTIKYFMLAAAAVAAMSCAKEIAPEINNTTNTVTFTAYADSGEETKVFYDGETKTTQWKVGDEIAIVKADGVLLGTFKATNVFNEGKEATFEAANVVYDETATYYAVSPASAYKGNDLAGTNRLYVDIPATQTAVAGSFDPKAFVSIATNSGNTLAFKNICGVIKFNLNDAANVKSVKFTVNGNTNLAGTQNIYTDNLTYHSWNNSFEGRTSYNTITLNAPANGFEANTDYYFTHKPFKQIGDTKDENYDAAKVGFKFYIESASGLNVRNGNIALTINRNNIQPVGPLDTEGKLNNITLVDAYNNGMEINVAGRVITKSLGNAIVVNDDNYVINDNGIYFVNPSVQGLTINKSTGAFTKLYIISNSVSKKASVTFSKELRYGSNGTVVLKNMDIKQYSSHMFVHNAGSTTATLVALDGCKITQPTSNGIIYNDNTRVVGTFAMHNCDVLVTGDSFNMINARADYNNVEYVNNIFYSTSDRKNFKLFNVHSGYTSNVTNIVFTNNSFINVYLHGTGMISPTTLSNSFVNKKNLFEYPNYKQINQTYRTMLRCTDDNGYPDSSNFNWETGWFYAGQDIDETQGSDDQKFAIKSSNKIVSDAVYPKKTSAFTTLDLENFTFVKTNDTMNIGATR